MMQRPIHIPGLYLCPIDENDLFERSLNRYDQSCTKYTLDLYQISEVPKFRLEDCDVNEGKFWDDERNYGIHVEV